MIANHLWQSTLFAGAAGLLTLALRKNPARARHWVWVVASFKFLVPFSVLMMLGSHVPWRTASLPTQTNLSLALNQVSQPFTAPVISAPLSSAAPPAPSVLPAVLWAVWAFGFIGIGCSWWIRWRRITDAVGAGSPAQLDLPIQAISSPSFLEPGIFGVFRQVLLLPEGIFNHLTPEQWKTVVAHELCHVRHRDNLIGAVQMFVETVFWFHPLVWWIGKRIFEERERACDEEVVKLGNEPRVYARGILRVCELYLQSPMPCMAGVSGSNLRMRIEAILNERIVKNLNGGTKALLAAAGLFAVATPIAIGLLDGVTVRAQTISQTLKFEVASVRPADPHSSDVSSSRDAGEGLDVRNISVRNLITLAYGLRDFQLKGGPSWIDSESYDVIAKAPGALDAAAESIEQRKTRFERVQERLRSLLADRFGLVVQHESREQSVYMLTVAKNGPKLVPVTAPAGPPHKEEGRGHSQGFAVPIEMLVVTLSNATHLTVIDKTGLTGRFDYTLNWDPASTSLSASPDAPPPDTSRPSLFAAVQEQLGLRLESGKAPADVIVIDHVDHPSAN